MIYGAMIWIAEKLQSDERDKALALWAAKGKQRSRWNVRQARAPGRAPAGPGMTDGGRRGPDIEDSDKNPNTRSGQPDLIRTMKLLGIPSLQASANFHRNPKKDDFGKVLRMAADIMTIDEVADYLRINKKTAYRLAADSKLSGFKVGCTWRFRRVDIEDWIEREASPKKDKKR